FTMENGEVYEPKNFNGYYANKPISLSQAIAVSDNIYAVKTNLFLKPENVVDTAKKFGIQSDLPNMPSLALGSASISLMEMTEIGRASCRERVEMMGVAGAVEKKLT